MKCCITAAAVLAGLCLAPAAQGQVNDFNAWSLVEDPPHANLAASIDAASQATLTGTGPVPTAADIGYASVNANTPAAATAGYAFDPAASFAFALDYDLTVAGTTGGIAIGMGIGGDVGGEDSAGVALAAANGTLLTGNRAARVNDAAVVNEIFALTPAAIGSLHLSFDASTGDITVGLGGTGDNAPAAGPNTTGVLDGDDVYSAWGLGNDLLLASFFLRSQGLPAQSIDPWATGDATAVFSDFRVTSGAAVVVPEPASAALALGAVAALARRRPR